jgi:putative transcriptional regulator
MSIDTTLDGKFLIAMPGMSDERFDRSVIFMCAHGPSGAMGLIINKAAPLMYFADLVEKLELNPVDGGFGIAEEILRKPVLYGGPVEQFRGFVLHSTEYFSAEHSLPICPEVALTATVDVLRDIAGGTGPRNAMLALGYSGWGPGQLEDEIQRNGWLHCDADLDLLFSDDMAGKYERAMAKLGIDPAMLSGEAGHG